MASRKRCWTIALMLGTGAGLTLFAAGASSAQLQQSGVLLTGTVKSDLGEKMAGVTVSAKRAGQTITTSVFTDDQGNYYFPKLATGKYRAWAQAEGFDAGRTEVDLDEASRHQDFTLIAKKDPQEIVKQMTGQEYITSLPEDTPQHRKMKDVFYNTCTGCHEPNYVLQNRFDEKGWEAILNLMARVQNGGGEYGGPDMPPFPVMVYYKKELAAYLAEMRGPGVSPMKLQLHPRPAGEAARAVTYEYDIPVVDADPANTDNGFPTNDGTDWSLGTPSALNSSRGLHDSQTDRNGNIWFTTSEPSFARSVSMLDTKTGEVTNIKVPGANGLAAPTHGLTMDPKGILWATVIGAPEGGGGSLLRVDPGTMKFDVFPPPKGSTGASTSIDVDAKGNVWATTSTGALRFDPNTHEYKQYKSPTPIDNGPGGSYGIAADRQGNGWWTQINIDRVNRADVETGETQEFKAPMRAARADGTLTEEDRKLYELAGTELTDFSAWWSQGPRRLGADKNGDVVWVCDYWGGNLTKFDTRTLNATIYKYPTPESAPYDASVDKNHKVWVNLTNGDSVARFDPQTEQWLEIPLPTRGIALRHISLDERTGPPQVIVGYTRNSKIARMQIRTREELRALKDQVQELSARANK
jgi:streptogramin lyase